MFDVRIRHFGSGPSILCVVLHFGLGQFFISINLFIDKSSLCGTLFMFKWELLHVDMFLVDNFFYGRFLGGDTTLDGNVSIMLLYVCT